MKYVFIAIISIISFSSQCDAQRYLLKKTVADGGGAITLVDTAGYVSSWTQNTTQSLTVSNSTNRVLIVFSMDYQSSPTAGAYGAQSMTLIGKVGNANDTVSAWKLVNPTAGTANVVMTNDGNNARSLACLVFSGVNQTTPTGTLDGATANWTNTLTGTTVSSASGEVVIQCCETNGGDGMLLTATSGQTKRMGWEGAANGSLGFVVSSQAGAASVSTGWTIAVQGNTTMAAFALKP